MDVVLRAYVWARCMVAAGLARDEAGEGVISTAIAVLIMAALGAVMWLGFKTIWGQASSQTSSQISTIGAGGPSPTGRGRTSMDERGGGPISIWVGFSVFLVMLLFAVQVLFNLYAASVVTAVSYDAARRVASSDGGAAAWNAAEAQARAELGRYQMRVSFDWNSTSADEVVLRVRAQNPHVMLPAFAAPAVFDRLDRTIRVRVERFR